MAERTRIQALRFGLGGFLATAIHVLLAYLLITSGTASTSVANGLAFIGATWVSYQVNTRWSFSVQPTAQRLQRFAVVALLGSMLSALIANRATAYGLPWLVGIMMVVICVPPLTFIVHRYWTYR